MRGDKPRAAPLQPVAEAPFASIDSLPLSPLACKTPVGRRRRPALPSPALPLSRLYTLKPRPCLQAERLQLQLVGHALRLLRLPSRPASGSPSQAAMHTATFLPRLPSGGGRRRGAPVRPPCGPRSCLSPAQLRSRRPTSLCPARVKVLQVFGERGPARFQDPWFLLSLFLFPSSHHPRVARALPQESTEAACTATPRPAKASAEADKDRGKAKGIAKQQEDLWARLACLKRARELVPVPAKATFSDFLSSVVSNARRDASPRSWARAVRTPAATHHTFLGSAAWTPAASGSACREVEDGNG
ncbi:uncharacterized protein LOC119319514 isoform X2 [Triticum dicoccoides]|uniref:uncharacterized protein LOC119319514 isoform X2 n=1 Tax=Triticum dicoccoides TaxID=85692 RepID=UPI001891C6C3|nr:uncharacterized protein LOC119319514 isoform X2 [Triticum dicoccoides]